MFTFESGQISKAIEPYLISEMGRRGVYINYVLKTPTKSKLMRGRSIQGMVKSGFVKFDKEASWYPDLENELMTVSDTGPRGTYDDQFDAFSYIGLTVAEYYEADSDEELEEMEFQKLLDSLDQSSVIRRLQGRSERTALTRDTRLAAVRYSYSR